MLPASVIFSFLLWFLVDPSSFHVYLEKPSIAALIFAVLCLWVYCATHLRKCAVSMKTARTVWFVIFASIVGPLLGKATTNSTDIEHGTYAYPFVQALIMVVIWTFFFSAHAQTRFIPAIPALAPFAGATASMIGSLSGSFSVILGVLAFYHVDNPAYTSAVGYLNSIFILLAYAVMGRKNDGNVAAGIGMVACAAVLIILKAQV